MQIFVVLLFLIAVIAAVIGYLHKNQLKKSREAAELNNPLPALIEEQGTSQTRQPISVVPELSTQKQQALSWQDEVKHLRDSGQFMEAISLCQRQYPRILAYRQTLITLRAQMKEDAGSTREVLESLYKTAILGNWVKSGTIKPGKYMPNNMEKLGNSKSYWQTLGYKHLEYLTKTDCKFLIEHWGEPNAHNRIQTLMDSSGEFDFSE